MTTLTSVHISPKPRLLPPDVQSRSLRTVLEDTHTSDFEVQYDIPVDRDLYNLAPSLGLPCGSTNGCTLNHYGTVLVRQFAKPGPAVYTHLPRRSLSRPCMPFGGVGLRSKTLSSHVQHPNLTYETVSHQWGIPAAIFTFQGMYTLQVWPVSPPPQQSRLHG